MANQFKIEQTDHEDTLDYPDASREYKDRLFRFVFRRKEDLLSLSTLFFTTALTGSRTERYCTFQIFLRSTAMESLPWNAGQSC